MPSLLLHITSLLVGILLLLTANGLLSSLLTLRLHAADVPMEDIGLLMSCYFVGMLLGARFADRIVRKVGHIRAFAAFAGVMTIAAQVHGMTLWLPLWGILRFIAGYAMAGLFLVIESWLNHRASPSNRGQLFSVYMITCHAGMSAGNQLLRIEEPQAMLLFQLAAILYAAALLPIALTKVEMPTLGTAEPLPLRTLWRRSPVGVGGAFAAGLLGGAFFAMGPLYASASGMNADGVARWMTVVIVGGALLQWPLGRLSDKVGRQIIYRLVCMALCVSCALLALLPDAPPTWKLLLAGVYGGVLFMVYPLSVAQANDWIRPEQMVPAAGALLLAYGVGAGVSPLLLGHLLTWGGVAAYGAYGAVIAAGLGVYAWFREHVRPPLPVEDQTPFVHMLRTSTALASLDPRRDDAQLDLPFDERDAL